MFTDALCNRAAHILDECRKKGIMLATAESCTGGLISALFTDIPGSSDAFERGYVTYSYRSKTELLGVENDVLEKYGAVSDQVVGIMARQAVERAGVDVAVAVSGIAGPDGAVPGKPVGTVFIGVATRDQLSVERHHFDGDRRKVREQTVEKALDMLEGIINRSFVYVA